MRMYVDGSYDAPSGIYGYGIVAVYPNGDVEKYGRAGNNRDISSIRNVAGEMIAAMCAVQLALQKQQKDVTICYDYTGIEYWATRTWKAKNNFSIKYGDFMRKMGDKISISFEKVSAHSGDLYNEMADAVAKAAVREFKRKECRV